MSAFLAALILTGLWMEIGSSLVRHLSFPLTPNPDWLGNGEAARASGWRTSLWWHALTWPLSLTGCERDEEDRGHWCRWVRYRWGYYTSEQTITMAVEEGYSGRCPSKQSVE